MFEYLKEFDKIIVTGPQRSGTRICAKMIAHDTGHDYIDESVILVDSFLQLWKRIHSEGKMVIHCPCLCRYAHMFGRIEGVAVVLMCRSVYAIMASEKRVDWGWELMELARYDLSKGCISEVKYDFWEAHQRDLIDNAFEVEYESLAAHPLWIDADARKDFKWNQTQ